MFSGADEYIIRWKDIKKIGEDVILAEVREATAFEDIHGGRSDRYRDYRGHGRYYDDELDLEDEEREKPSRKLEPRDDMRDEEASAQSSWKRQEKEGFFRARVKNTAARDDPSEIRIRLKDEDDANLDDD